MRQLPLILLLIVAAGCASGVVDLPEGRQADELLVYRTAGERVLKLHMFRPAATNQASPSPAILFFFGGGWNGGSPTQFYPQSEYFAKLGVVAICVEYRTYTSDATPPIVALLDAKAAMRYVRSHAEDLKIDPKRIVASGASAGGQLAAALAVAHRIEDWDVDLSISTRPDALILYNAVIDNSPEGFAYSRVESYWEAFSPLHNIGNNHPPAIFFLGTDDQHIPVRMAEAYKDAVEANGSRMDLHLYEGASHGFFNKFRSLPYYEDTTRKAHAFLYELGFVAVAPPQQLMP